MNSDSKESVMERSLGYMPKTAWAICAIMFVFSIAARQMGLDISTPVNTIFQAKAEAIRAESLGKGTGECSVEEGVLRGLDERLVVLEGVSHSPSR